MNATRRIGTAIATTSMDSREGGNDAIDSAAVAAIAVIPAQAGIHMA